METIGYRPREIETVVNTNDLSVVLRDSSPDITAEITSDIEGVYFSLFGGDITEIEVVVPISDVAVHIERDGTMEINGTFDGGMEVLVCLDAMFGHTHDGRYYTKDESDDLIGGSEQRSMEYSDRSFAQAQEAQEMLRQSMLTYFSESINPVTVQTMSLLAGAVELQYRYVNSKTTPSVTVDGIYWNNTAKSLLVPANGIIQHMTIGITSITSARSASDYRYWDMQPFDSGALADGTKKYWLYAQVRRTGNTSSSDKDGYRLSETALAFEDDVNYPAYYNLLVGLLSSETNANRSWVTMYGFTEILPGRITTDLIVSPSGKTYINLSAGEGEGEIGGKIKFIGSNGTVQNLDSTVDGLQAQIDGQIIAWFQEHDPTLANYPANEWTTDALKDQHLNDTFTNNSTGGCWRFAKVAGVYSWTVISDTATQQALIAAGHAQDTADGKKRVFTATPTTPYDVGDLWPGLSAGDLKVCTTARATGAYVGGDWVLATKYTDDTTANAAALAAFNAQTSANTANSLLSDISNDGKLTPVEKQSTKLEWDVIVAEKSKIDGQADYYGVSKTAYGAAYSTLSSYISPLLADLGATSNITGTTFRSNFAAYYAARQNLLDDIAEAAKDLGDLANANAIAAALVGNPNLIPNGWRNISGHRYPYEVQTNAVYLTAGITYTWSVRAKVVSGTPQALVIIWYDDWTSLAELYFTETSYETKSVLFVPSKTGWYHVGSFSWPGGNGGICSTLWYMLQEGNVYIDQNTVFKQTAEESIANLENLLEDSVERSITSGDDERNPRYTDLRLASVFYNATYPQFQVVLLNNFLYTFTINNSELSSGDIFSVTLYNITDDNTLGSPLVDNAVPVGIKYTVTFRVPNDGKNWALLVYAGVRGSTNGKTITVHKLMLQYGPFSTPWRRALSETAAGIAAGLEAKAKTDGFTTIEGGLITTNLIKLGDTEENETAGISGMADNITLYGGGSYAQAVAALLGGAPLPVLLTKLGAGSNIGCLKIIDANTVEVDNGGYKVILTTNSIAGYLADYDDSYTFSRSTAIANLAEGSTLLQSNQTVAKTSGYHARVNPGSISFTLTSGSNISVAIDYNIVVNGVRHLVRSLAATTTGIKTMPLTKSVINWDVDITAGQTVNHELYYTNNSEIRPSISVSFTNFYGATLSEVFKGTLLASDGICTQKDSYNKFVVQGASESLVLSFSGKIGSTVGDLSVDSNGFLKFN